MLAEGGVLSELPRRGEELPTVGMQETENLPLCKTDIVFFV
jgi:hypothetical protein